HARRGRQHCLPAVAAHHGVRGGGRGVTTVNVWQSRGQARDWWGPDAERAIWGASTVQLVLGGLSDAQDLNDLSTLIGSRDERTESASWNPSGDGVRVRCSLRTGAPRHRGGACDLEGAGRTWGTGLTPTWRV